MDIAQKQARYARIQAQLKEILAKCEDEDARMASVVALLHHKMSHFFWTGFYGLKDSRLIVKLYQGPIACMELKKDTGVCWSAINSGTTVIVPNVELFPGRIACDSRSKSEICVPFYNKTGVITAVLDIDSDEFSNFDKVDEHELQQILALINEISKSTN